MRFDVALCTEVENYNFLKKSEQILFNPCGIYMPLYQPWVSGNHYVHIFLSMSQALKRSWKCATQSKGMAPPAHSIVFWVDEDKFVMSFCAIWCICSISTRIKIPIYSGCLNSCCYYNYLKIVNCAVKSICQDFVYNKTRHSDLYSAYTLKATEVYNSDPVFAIE